MCSSVKIKGVLIVLCFAVSLTGCRKQKEELIPSVKTDVVLKVSVLQSSKILVDGNESEVTPKNCTIAE